jgi:hypothetical protein
VKSPIAVTLNESSGLHHGFDDDARGVGLIVQVIARVGRGTPFRVIERFAARFAVGVLRPLTKDASLAVGKLRFGIFSNRAQRVRGIVVRADEIGGTLFFSQKSKNSVIHSFLAVAGPPTCRR